MVIYDLVCESGHQFEGWFRNVDDLKSQKESGLLSCPYCDSRSVTKKLTASKIAKKSNTRASQNVQNVTVSGGSSKEAYSQLQSMLGKVHDFVETNFEDVGNRFADEAISIHRGEKDAVNIRGTASQEQLKELADEGVSALPLPPKPINKKVLN